jgi:6-phosphogluconolactonase
MEAMPLAHSFTPFGKSLMLLLAGAGLSLAAGCGHGHFFVDTSGGGGNTTGAGDYLYVGTQTGVIAGFAVSTTGALTAVAGTPFNFSQGTAITAMVVTPSNAFMYASGSGGVFLLSINASTGALTVGNNGSALVSDVAPTVLRVDPTGKFLLAAGFDPSTGLPSIAVYTINSDGTLTIVGTPLAIPLPSGASTSSAPVQMVIMPTDSFVFVSMGTVGVVSMTFNSSGQLSQTGKTNAPGTSTGPTGAVPNQDLALALNSGGTLLFVGETNVGVRVNTIAADSSLTAVSGSPFKTAGQPSAMSFDGSGGYLYVTNQSTNNITGFSVLASGTLTELTSAGSPFAAGSTPTSLSIDQSKKFLAVANSGGTPDLQIYGFDTTTAGKLDPGATAATSSSSPGQASIVVGTH